jgi:Protein of unknown function (DUF2934)
LPGINIAPAAHFSDSGIAVATQIHPLAERPRFFSPGKPQDFDPLRFCAYAGPTAQERHALIAKAAYYRAQRRGFRPGHELDDWLAAETEVDRQLRARGSGSMR